MRKVLGALLGVLLVANLGWWVHSSTAWAQIGPDRLGPSLSELMGEMQRLTHKLVLSANAGNTELVEFYLHELEESSERIQAEFEAYDGHQIASLMAAMLDPQIERLEAQEPPADEAIGQLIDACNQCHVATEHGFIRIVERGDNPYMQAF